MTPGVGNGRQTRPCRRCLWDRVGQQRTNHGHWRLITLNPSIQGMKGNGLHTGASIGLSKWQKRKRGYQPALKEGKNLKNKTKKNISTKKKKEASRDTSPKTAQNFVKKMVTRNREAIEAKKKTKPWSLTRFGRCAHGSGQPENRRSRHPTACT